MQRVQDPTASATLVAPPALTGPVGYFQPAVPGVTAATRFRYWLATMWQEELMAILAAAAVAPDTTGTNFTQVVQSITKLIAAATLQIFNGTVGYTIDPAGIWDQTTLGAITAAGGGITTALFTLNFAFPTAMLDNPVIQFSGTTPPAGCGLAAAPYSRSQALVAINIPAGVPLTTYGILLRCRGN
jgi:hypothetical protein